MIKMERRRIKVRLSKERTREKQRSSRKRQKKLTIFRINRVLQKQMTILLSIHLRYP